jgi:hypothetical protein
LTHFSSVDSSIPPGTSPTTSYAKSFLDEISKSPSKEPVDIVACTEYCIMKQYIENVVQALPRDADNNWILERHDTVDETHRGLAVASSSIYKVSKKKKKDPEEAETVENRLLMISLSPWDVSSDDIQAFVNVEMVRYPLSRL